jgi:hypothetical protein
MSVHKQLFLGLALGALVLSFAAMPARAETVLKGTFELPTQAYWGSTLLQPGTYTFWMNAERGRLLGVPAVHVSGEGTTTTLLTMARPERVSQRSYLTVEDIGGTYVIRKFNAGFLGESFSFAVTKDVRKKAMRADLRDATTFEVNTSAGF